MAASLPSEEREALENLLQVHDLPRDELGDREADDVDGLGDVGDDASDLCACQAAWYGAETKQDLVAVDRIDVEVDGDPGSAGADQPMKQVRLDSRSSSGLKACRPHSATWG